MEIHFKIIGTLLIILALIHVFFPKYFKWKHELKSLSLMNRQMMKVHLFFIALIVFLMGILCLIASRELMQTPLGHLISFGLFVFWFTRFIFQLFVYSPKLWRGKKFETFIHLLFIVFWSYLSFIFLWAAVC